MLSVQITPRRKKYVSFIEDTIPNKGGFFCKVYDDPNGEFESDCFTIFKCIIYNIIDITQEFLKTLSKKTTAFIYII